MAFDAVLNFPNKSSTGIAIEGESNIVKNGIVLIDEWSFSLENKLNITQHTSGAGAGKAEFDAFTIKKQLDSASANLFSACGSGAHFQGVTVRLFKASGNFSDATSNCFACWTFNQLAVEKIEWSYSDPVTVENVTFKFGSCAIVYGQQNAGGSIKKAGFASWNQISNTSSFAEGIKGGASPVNVLP
jgi:type VI secretion system secreted protein Hcp